MKIKDIMQDYFGIKKNDADSENIHKMTYEKTSRKISENKANKICSLALVLGMSSPIAAGDMPFTIDRYADGYESDKVADLDSNRYVGLDEKNGFYISDGKKVVSLKSLPENKDSFEDDDSGRFYAIDNSIGNDTTNFPEKIFFVGYQDKLAAVYEKVFSYKDRDQEEKAIYENGSEYIRISVRSKEAGHNVNDHLKVDRKLGNDDKLILEKYKNANR